MNIASEYKSDDYVQTGDFSERMSKILSFIVQNYEAEFAKSENNVLNQAQLTNILYLHDLKSLKKAVQEYLEVKDGLWILIDNIDKGWPATGLEADDVLMVRTLVEATRKIEREISKQDIECHTLIFVRNDVYELLVSNTPDRGKEGLIEIDWTDPDLLREVLRLRLVYNGVAPDAKFDNIWREICVPLVNSRESSQYIIDRSLMRPRNLIQLLEYCVSSAVNLHHSRILEDDINKGLYSFSLGLVDNFGLELRDVYSEAENILYAFIKSDYLLSYEELCKKIVQSGYSLGIVDEIINILIWFSFLGIEESIDRIKYIYDTHYRFELLIGGSGNDRLKLLNYSVNPAFWKALDIVIQ